MAGKDDGDREARKNLNFVQYDRDNMTALRLINRKNPYANELFMFLSQKMDSKNCVSCSQKVLQEALGCSRTSIYRAIRDLQEANLMVVIKSGTARVFVLNHKVVWSTWNTKKKYCEFDGKVLVSKQENKELEKKLKSFKHLELKMEQDVSS